MGPVQLSTLSYAKSCFSEARGLTGDTGTEGGGGKSGTDMRQARGRYRDSGPVIILKHGRVRGKYITVKGSDKVVEQYLSIPYAQPPVGPLRLAAPQPAEPWEGDSDDIKSVSGMFKLNFTLTPVSEDCLYLDVYTPSQRSPSENLPVMFWIHGGGLNMGGAVSHDGSVLAAYENIVVVIIQYRLSILGFFSTGDKHAQGNWGFLDQIAALQWVQQNIKSFGGDPHSVTIAGNSAGAISSSMLTISPLAKGLFHRAIFQSGTATLGAYSTKDPEAFVKHKIFLGASVDGEFLTDVAEKVLISKNFEKVPVLIGVTNHEFGWILPLNFAPAGWEKGMNREAVTLVVNQFVPNGVAGANDLIIDEYLKHAQTPDGIRDEFTHMVGDLIMVFPVLKVADYHRDAGADVYMYEFQHRPNLFKDSRPSFVKADHTDDIFFVLGACFWNNHIKVIGTITEEENQLCKTIMGYWSNFVRTGSPNGPGLVNWPLYDASHKYLALGLKQTEEQGLRQDKLRFITQELPQKLAALLTA
ncbi:Pyrethroid hydrolase Ces2e [Bagarius yarrelli]|uniref:Carboxylic ester hydrolase n=1 Tax=Bagarius yarrelli TaxID=175774 RepID=A0A556TR27_BAGYA|nr:Pyrethroid hydrolase Ces2e [Bagarius yarrelli]